MKSFYLLILGLVIIACRQNHDMIMKTKDYVSISDDLELYIETYGKQGDEACLFISGAGANSSFWSDRLCNRLVGEGFFVVKYDHRDFGYSSKIDWEKSPYDFMQLAEDATVILDSLGIKKAHVVGHSMGGFIVQLLGIHYQERVRSVTSISASTNSPKVPPPPDETWEIFTSNMPVNDFEKDLPGFLEVWEYLNGTAGFDKELAIEYTRNLYERQPVDGALGASHVKAQETLTDRTDQLRQVKIPTLVMHGEEDYIVDQYAAIQTAEAIEGAKLVLIPEMGHLPFNHEILQRFENEIVAFLTTRRDIK